MKTLKLFVALSLFFTSMNVNVIAQTNDDDDDDDFSGSQVYTELGGAGVVFSINYDSRFQKGADRGFGYRVGLGFGIADFYDNYDYVDDYYNSSYETRSYVTIPLGVNYVFGKKKSAHAFEVGAGMTILTREVDLYNFDDNSGKGYLIGHTSFMYRRKPINGGFTWRIGFTPIIGTAGSISPSAAVGFGYTF